MDPKTPTTPSPAEVTRLLERAHGGDPHAAAELLPLVYDELRKLARKRMGAEREGGVGQTLQPTALVHEAYLRLVGESEVRWSGRGHFFGAAALAMRRILVDRARQRQSLKRGGGEPAVPLELDPAIGPEEPPPDAMLALDEALDRLAPFGQRRVDVVMLRYFAGLSVEETALSLGVSEATVKNEWRFARAWLKRELGLEPEESA